MSPTPGCAIYTPLLPLSDDLLALLVIIPNTYPRTAFRTSCSILLPTEAAVRVIASPSAIETARPPVSIRGLVPIKGNFKRDSGTQILKKQERSLERTSENDWKTPTHTRFNFGAQIRKEEVFRSAPQVLLCLFVPTIVHPLTLPVLVSFSSHFGVSREDVQAST